MSMSEVADMMRDANLRALEDEVSKLHAKLAEVGCDNVRNEARRRDAEQSLRNELDRQLATNVELTKKIGTLNARIDELTAKPEQSAPEVRCPDCGGACEFDFASWGCRASEEKCGIGELSDHEVWRRWGDTNKADGIYWVKWSDDRRVRVVTAAYHNLDDTHWVLGPLPEPHAPGVG